MLLLNWLSSRMFYPLFALSVVAMLLYECWHGVVGPWEGPRLHLNLALAWMPYVFALAAVACQQRAPDARWAMRAVLLLWLLFFPNAPYLITDWKYLPGWTHEMWYSVVMMTAFSLSGLLLSTISLYLVHTVVSMRAGKEMGWALALAAILLSGVGVYLGRFLRLNSWDLLYRPGQVLADAMVCFREHPSHVGPLGFSLLFMLLLGAIYYAVLGIRHVRWSREEVHVWNDNHRHRRD